MAEKINIAEILKECPKGMELDCSMWNNVVFDHIDTTSNYPIYIKKMGGELEYLTEDGHFNFDCDAKCVIFPKGKTTWEGFVPPYKFKDGDVLVHTQNGRFIMSIYKSNENEKLINTHVIFWDREEGLSVGMQICCYTDNVRFATKEEKAKLFQAIKDNGYKWHEETKTLEKLPKFKVGDKIRHKTNNEDIIYEISAVYDDFYGLVDYAFMLDMKYQDLYELVPNKFEITTLIPFESRVLIRNGDRDHWRPAIFGGYAKDKDNEIEYYYALGGTCWRNCIPYEGNEHLLSTTDDCDEYFKNW